MDYPPSSKPQTVGSVEAFQRLLVHHLYYTRGQAIQTASARDTYMALCHTVRDHLVDRWRKTTEAHYAANPKFVYYLSAEYLLGKQLPQNLLYTGTTELARRALAAHGVKLEEILELDAEPGLGNGGLGRLAACYIDSLATMDVPAVGYGLRYEFGIFAQRFQNGWQVETPDEWLLYGSPWEFPQSDQMIEVGVRGHTEQYADERGNRRFRWHPARRILGEPCTMLVPGFGTTTVNMLRLWRARAKVEFDFQLFNAGDYVRAVERKVLSENITKVLYPNDNSPQGRMLRLEQQYFFIACSINDIIRRFQLKNQDWDRLPDKVAIQLNDTHPVLAIPELMRILIDVHHLEWERAWDITCNTFAYTCHTLLPEALEKWPVDLFGNLLPRHLQIVFEINNWLLKKVRARWPGDTARVARMSLIEEHPQRQVCMAHLASTGCFAINGVAELQSRLLKERTLRDFAELWPEKFQNKTNGVTPRRFIRMANPRLAELISSRIGDGWLTNLELLRGLEDHADDPQFRSAWRSVKLANKEELAQILAASMGTAVRTDSLFDVMVKRLHEYKRQLLKTLHIITIYHRLKANPSMEMVPRTFLFGAKAAPGYHMAKQIIKLIHSVAAVIDEDPDVAGRLKVVFPANFNVSLAERIYPAADISEQISMAGKEASGTGNMKFALNGALTVGTLDGANIEIRDHVGADNFFLFGLTSDEVFALHERGYHPADHLTDVELKDAINAIGSGRFSGGDVELFKPIADSLIYHDEYMLVADFSAYVECCERAAQAYLDEEKWTRMSILNCARCGFFSSDRAVQQYCDDIWKVEPLTAR